MFPIQHKDSESIANKQSLFTTSAKKTHKALLKNRTYPTLKCHTNLEPNCQQDGNQALKRENDIQQLYYLFFRYDEAIKITAHKVSYHQTWIEHCELGYMRTSISHRNGKIIESIGQTVRKATIDEKRHSEQ